MIKLENQPAIDTLLEMGYQPDVISLAMEESQNKSLEEVLDLLLFREPHYQKVLKKSKEKGIPPKPKKKYSLDDQPKFSKPSKKSKNTRYGSASDEDWIDEDLIDREEPIEVTQIGFGMVPKSVTLGKSKSENKDIKREASNDILQEELPKEMDNETASHLDKIVQGLKDTNFKDANTYINLINGHVNTIRNDSSSANKMLQRYIVAHGTFSQITELKNQVFAVLSKILNMKVKKSNSVEMKKLEQALLAVFEMRLMSPKQLDSILTLYGSFRQRLLYPEDQVFESKLEKYYSDASKQLPIAWKPNVENNPEPNKEVVETKKNDSKGEFVEEKKVSEMPEIREAEEDASEPAEEDAGEPTEAKGEIEGLPEGFNIVNYGKTRVVDDCVICMEKTREVVFLPCCHFLTCPLCSPRVMKCPMCNKRIDKHLKINWS